MVFRRDLLINYKNIQGKLITIDVYLNYYNICMPENIRKAKIRDLNEMYSLKLLGATN